MLSNFKKDYWTQQCGKDAYLYLAIQRKLIKLTGVMGLTTLVANLILNLFNLGEGMTWIEENVLGVEELSQTRAWTYAGLTCFFSVLAFKMILEMREEVIQTGAPSLSKL
jgi:hypothetical protein